MTGAATCRLLVLPALLVMACSSKAGDAGFTPASCADGCPANQVCFQNTCVSDCIAAGGLSCTGVCIDPTSDSQNCGGCGQSCAGGEFCLNGSCASSCPASLEPCTNDAGSTTCADLIGDARNCGACGNRCAIGQVCADGGCQLFEMLCAEGQTLCADLDGGGICEELSTDPSHCGSCTIACTPWEQCVQGTCHPPTGCPTGLQLCTSASGSATCADLQTDPNNCGHCGDSCGGGGVCVGGGCSCHAGFTTCASASGSACVDLATDPIHCGSCGQTCVSCESCFAASCTAGPSLVAGTSVSYGGGHGYAPLNVAVGDFNADGKNDLAVLGYKGGLKLEIDFGDGGGGFTSSSIYNFDWAQCDIAAGDVNGDGLSDVVISIVGLHGPSTGSGFLVLKTLTDGGQELVGPIESNPSEANTWCLIGVVVADFNTDGIADVAISNPDYGVDLFYGLGDGGFQKLSQVVAGAVDPFSTTAGDLNGDGRTDLAVMTDSAAAVLIQTVDGGLGSPIQTPASSSVVVIAGGYLVLAAPPSFSIYQLDAGSLVSFASYTMPDPSGASSWTSAGVAVDLNQDGITDLVLSGNGAVTAWLGHGPGLGFGQPSIVRVGDSYGLAAGDLNGDGRPDIAAAGGAESIAATTIFLNECAP